MTAAPAPQALEGRVVLVTGAHGGLGSAAVMACARAGATVVLLGRRIPKLNRVHDAVVAQGGRAPLLYPMDLEGASPDDHLELAGRLGDEFGRLDGLLHCAAWFAGLTPFEQADPAALARAIHVNLTAPLWLTQACLPLLRRSPDGAVVFTVDDPARIGHAYWGGYGLAHLGLAGLVPMLQEEFGAGTVRVAGLRPGPMRTPLRAKAYVEEDDVVARDPGLYASACVALLSAAGARHRGEVWAPAPGEGAPA
ncbi:MAG TPA: SDR family NAD(P)-dependent oxidoreductase [Xanthomonadaceae bacterium]|nr:SDR family NAD(P)-dependent oxidoreductase [Xanthomonadaceae bacterium]